MGGPGGNAPQDEDLCLYTYGKYYQVANGSFANMKLGKRQYLIQQNWVNKNGGDCASKWDERGALRTGASRARTAPDWLGRVCYGPAGIRTQNQGIHCGPQFPAGVDYLFTLATRDTWA